MHGCSFCKISGNNKNVEFWQHMFSIVNFLTRLRDILFQKDVKIKELTDENAFLKAQIAEALAKDKADEEQITAANEAANQARTEVDTIKQQIDSERLELEAAIESFLEEVEPSNEV